MRVVSLRRRQARANRRSAILPSIPCPPGGHYAVTTAYRFSDHPTPAADVISIWRLDRMAGRPGWTDARSMSVSSNQTPPYRAPDNELYDRGCDLVEAAAAIRRVSGDADAARAVPAVLGCIESALHELLWASAALEETTTRSVAGRLVQCSDPRMQPRSERMQQGYANLQGALADAERAAAAARSLAGRALVAGEAVGTPRSRR
jgi:hypothetical protein